LPPAIRRVRLMMRRRGRKPRRPCGVSFEADGAGANRADGRERTGRRAGGWPVLGEELVVAFNPNYLLDGVEAIRAEIVILEVIDSSKPATIRGEGEDDYRYLLMPVRVS